MHASIITFYYKEPIKHNLELLKQLEKEKFIEGRNKKKHLQEGEQVYISGIKKIYFLPIYMEDLNKLKNCKLPQNKSTPQNKFTIYWSMDEKSSIFSWQQNWQKRHARTKEI